MITLGAVYQSPLYTFNASGLGLVSASSSVVPPGAVAANVTDLAVTITLPDGSLTVIAPTNTATGQYLLNYLPVQSGRHIVRWLGTTPFNVAYVDVFDVSLMAPPQILSLADAKKQLSIDPADTGDDAELLEWLQGITTAAENYKHEAIPLQTVTEEHTFGRGSGDLWNRTWPGRGSFRLWKYPTIALISIAATDNTFTWDVTNFDLDNTTGIVDLIIGPPVSGRANVMYTAGYKIMPTNYLLATRMLLQALWETRRGPGGLGGVIGPEELADYRHYTSLPRKVQEMFGPPRPLVA